MGWFRSVMVGLALFGASGALLPARAQTAVDLALVIAVGVSASMAPDEQDLQREGYAEAFRDPLVQAAIREGVIGRIAVTYLDDLHGVVGLGRSVDRAAVDSAGQSLHARSGPTFGFVEEAR
ncbi:DUF1194 domain-containing protein [Microvirga sp. M2]|uniref:DUF1194 domain-containing protein n=1 Tax=Microvirga sp. M2 TaxID=3073270 RepID=UPI0039C274A9